ncbi:MAG: hypothetical protein Q9227_003089 [Pyrenula ochraceoflavens]
MSNTSMLQLLGSKELDPNADFADGSRNLKSAMEEAKAGDVVPLRNLCGRTNRARSTRVTLRTANKGPSRKKIGCAESTGTQFLVTGPRHGFYTGFDKLQGALEIYTAAFDKITVNADANTMTVDGAVHFQDVVEALYAVGKNIRESILDLGPCVGIVGATMGAGLGRLQGLYGFISDNLLSARLMLPDTTVIEVSSESNPELFWGLRGAGFNFGFVLNATYRVHDEVPNGQHFNADFQFPLNATRAFFQALKDHGSQLPAPLCIDAAVLWNSTLNSTSLYVNAVYAGPENEGRKAIDFLSEIGSPIRQSQSVVPWRELTQTAFFQEFGLGEASLTCGITEGIRKAFGAAYNTVNVDSQVQAHELFNEMVTRFPGTRASDMSLQFCAQQGTNAFSDDSTAYSWRKALGQQAFTITYPSNGTTDADIDNLPERMRDAIAATADTDGLAVYVGFSGGDEPIEAIWSKDHLPRLAALKKQYDPNGLFNAYHPLPTVY